MYLPKISGKIHLNFVLKIRKQNVSTFINLLIPIFLISCPLIIAAEQQSSSSDQNSHHLQNNNSSVSEADSADNANKLTQSKLPVNIWDLFKNTKYCKCVKDIIESEDSNLAGDLLEQPRYINIYCEHCTESELLKKLGVYARQLSKMEQNRTDKDPLITVKKLHLFNNTLSELKRELFVGLHPLTLILNECAIQRIQDNTFQDLAPTLKILFWLQSQSQPLENEGSNATQTGIDISQAFRKLSNLEKMYLAVWDIRILPSNFCAQCGNLTKLFLECNNALEIHSDWFSGINRNLSTFHLKCPNNENFTHEMFDYLSGLHLIHLNIKGFSSIPQNFFGGLTNLSHLELVATNLQTFDSNIFDSIQGTLKTLNLRLNKFQKLDPAWLGKLVNLEVLDLSYNYITKIRATDLTANRKLRFLDLQLNEISEIEDNSFLFNEALEYLDLYLNDIHAWTDKTFLGPPLKVLNARSNQIQKLVSGVFPPNCAQMKTLDLSFNSIHEIEPGAFSHLQKLVSLDLYNADITDKALPYLVPMQNLKHLNLSQNKISILNESMCQVLDHLETFEFMGNRLDCSASDALQPFQKCLKRWIQSTESNTPEVSVDRGRLFQALGLRCSMPPALAGYPLLHIRFDQNDTKARNSSNDNNILNNTLNSTNTSSISNISSHTISDQPSHIPDTNNDTMISTTSNTLSSTLISGESTTSKVSTIIPDDTQQGQTQAILEENGNLETQQMPKSRLSSVVFALTLLIASLTMLGCFWFLYYYKYYGKIRDYLKANKAFGFKRFTNKFSSSPLSRSTSHLLGHTPYYYNSPPIHISS